MTGMTPEETNSRATTGSSCLSPGYGSRGNVVSPGEDACTPMLTVALFTASKMEPAKCLSIDEWIKKTGADTTWSFINPQMTKLCDLQENGQN